MKVALLGGTRGIGRAVARRLAEEGDRLFLLGRDDDELARSARDLEQRAVAAGHTLEVGHARCDLAEPGGFGAALDAADEALDGFDALVITAARFAPQQALEADPEEALRVSTVNYANTVALCEHARPRLLERRGVLCVLTSVAGDRGRKPVVIYGASKAGLSAYLEGLDHRHRLEGLGVVDVRPGFVRTSMTDGLRPPPFAGEPGPVARDVVRALRRRTPVVYTPWIWRWVMLAIRLLPRFVMRRIGF
ncbi:MAG: SDR family NAD(P)-dependent oxidoreductase [Acidobacteria bacterium]|nr:MAG: SDR family NAD(P)-dependent oxidoreductase [Acidobacteriota bacterium]